MADLIQADYEQLGDIGSRFQTQSEATVQMRSRVGRALDALKNDGWIGLGADAFFREMDADVLPAMYRLEEALREAAAVTNQIVDLLNSADENAASPFRRESGSGSASPIGSGGTADGGTGGSEGAGPGAGATTPVGDTPLNTPPNGMVGINPGDNDFGIPRDWLSGVTDSLPGGDGNLDSNWLDNVKDSFGLADSGGGSGSGGGASGGGDDSSIASRAGSGLPGDGSDGGAGSGSTGSGSGSGFTGSGAGGGSTGSGMGGGTTGGGSGSGSTGDGTGGGTTGGGSGSGSTGSGSGSSAGSGFPSSSTSPYQTPGEAGFRAGMSDFAGTGSSGAGASFAAGSGAGGPGQSGGGGGSLLDRAGSTAGTGADGESSLGSMGVPIGIAAASPFLALLGKALKDNDDDE